MSTRKRFGDPTKVRKPLLKRNRRIRFPEFSQRLIGRSLVHHHAHRVALIDRVQRDEIPALLTQLEQL